MGWNPFKPKKHIFVSSLSSSLQGTFEDRGSYLITTLVGSIISRPDKPLAESFTACYLKSPGTALPMWLRNVIQNDLYEVPTITSITYSAPDIELIKDNLIPNIAGGYTKVVQGAVINVADYLWWARRWVLDNYPERASEDWSADTYTNELGEVAFKIKFSDAEYTFVPTDFISGDLYLYVMYYHSIEGAIISTTVEETVELSPTLPDLTDYVLISSVNNNEPVTLTETTKVTKSYSDGRPNEVTTTTSDSTVDVVINTDTYEKADYTLNSENESVKKNTHTYTISTDYIVGSTTSTTSSSEVIGGVTVTTTTEVTTESVDSSYYSWELTLTVTDVVLNLSSKIIIYRFGSNDNAAIEAHLTDISVITEDKFYPVIPLRIDNVSILDDAYAAEYAKASKIYQLLAKTQLKNLVDVFENTDGLSDIDYGALHFGAALNNPRKEVREYILKFFQRYSASITTDPTIVDNVLNVLTDYANYRIAYAQWLEGLANGTATEADKPIEPTSGGYISMPGTILKIKGTESADFFDVRISWDYFRQEVYSGVATVDGAPMKVNDINFTVVDRNFVLGTMIPPHSDGSYESTIDPTALEDVSEDSEYYSLLITKQLTDLEFLQVEISGLTYRNYIYSGKYTELTVKDGLQGEEGDTTINPLLEDTSFIIPLQPDILQEMSLVYRTQVCSECQYIMANAYEVVKEKWYQTSIFKIVLIIIIIVVAYFTGYYDPSSAGLLGTAASVGAALGFTGVAAIIVGIIANTLAAMIVAAIISKVAVALLGEEIGSIVGIIASIYIIVATGNYQDTGTFAFNIADISIAQLTLYGTSIANSAMSGYAAGQIADMQQDLANLQSEYGDAIDEIMEATNQYLSPYTTSVNINGIVSSFIYEKAYTNNVFNTDLMTGDDICKLSDAIVYSFHEITLQLNV